MDVSQIPTSKLREILAEREREEALQRTSLHVKDLVVRYLALGHKATGTWNISYQDGKNTIDLGNYVGHVADIAGLFIGRIDSAYALKLTPMPPATPRAHEPLTGSIMIELPWDARISNLTPAAAAQFVDLWLGTDETPRHVEFKVSPSSRLNAATLEIKPR